jgi:hypothetical protein
MLLFPPERPIVSEPTEQFEDFASRLIGHRVSFTRLAGNSLLIYVDCEPSDNKGLTIWFEPTWHLGSPRGVLLGSRQAQVDGKEAHSRVAEPLDQLAGKAIEKVLIEEITFDLRVVFEGGYWITTFVSDPTDDESWHITDNSSKLQLFASPAGLQIVER